MALMSNNTRRNYSPSKGVSGVMTPSDDTSLFAINTSETKNVAPNSLISL